MPSDYTHLHFGEKIINVLPESFSHAAKEYPELFEIGLQGPDILFFYHPLKKCSVNQTGYAMHEISAKEFFFPAQEILKSVPNRSAALAYLSGFLGHYALDTTCHGYIENKIAVSGLTHSEIEKEFDRYLMELDRIKGTELNSSASIVASKRNAKVITDFFPTISADIIQKSLQSMRILTDMLSGKGLRRPIVTLALKVSGQYQKLHDMLRPRKQVPGSEDSDLRLEKLMEKALYRYEKFALEYEAFLQGGEFPAELDATFGPGKNWRDIPVLTLKEEKTYEV